MEIEFKPQPEPNWRSMYAQERQDRLELQKRYESAIQMLAQCKQLIIDLRGYY